MQIKISDVFLNRDVRWLVDNLRRTFDEFDDVVCRTNKDVSDDNILVDMYRKWFSTFVSQNPDREIIAEVIQVVLLRQMLCHDHLFSAIKTFYHQRQIKHDKAEVAVDEGVIIGLLKSAIRITTDTFPMSRYAYFEDRIAQGLVIVAEKGYPTSCVDIEPALSQLFDRYLNPGQPPGLKGTRYAQACYIVGELRSRIELLKGASESPVLRIITDQIAYKLFSNVSTLGRAIAVDSLAQYVLKSDKRKAVPSNESGPCFAKDPLCPNCGHVTVRNGTFRKCLNCGESQNA